MKKQEIDYSLYLCTDRGLMSADTLEEAVEQAIRGGCTVIQLREKNCSSREFYETAQRIHEVTRRYQVPLIINDRVDIALAVDAEGVHVGQRDLPVGAVRALMGEEKIIGVSTARRAEAEQAVADGADYLGVGAMFPTGTKGDVRPVTMEELRAIRSAVEVPIVAIGGVNHRTAYQLKGTGIDGLAVVSAVIGAEDIEQSARELARIFRE